MKKSKKKKGAFLLPTVSFVTGMGSIFNVSGNFYQFKTSRTPLEADMRAIKSDWEKVGEDFKDAMEKLAIN